MEKDNSRNQHYNPCFQISRGNLGNHLPQIKGLCPLSIPAKLMLVSSLFSREQALAGETTESHNHYKVKLALTCRQGVYKLALLDFSSTSRRRSGLVNLGTYKSKSLLVSSHQHIYSIR